MSGTDAPAQPLRIGEVTPPFSARSTHGSFELASCRGRWVLLFAHPADFTPVCTSEFVAFARCHAAFEALGVTLVGLSVDSLYAHLAWIEAIERELGVTIPFPIIEDSNMVISRAWGMLSADATSSETVRACIFIDPDGIVQATLSYPSHVGRSVAELLRLATALVATRAEAQLAPESWQAGEPLLPQPPTRAADLTSGWFAPPARPRDAASQ